MPRSAAAKRRDKKRKEAVKKKTAEEKKDKEGTKGSTTEVKEEEEAPEVENRQSCEKKCKNIRGITSRRGCIGGCRQKYPKKYVDHPVYGRLRY